MKSSPENSNADTDASSTPIDFDGDPLWQIDREIDSLPENAPVIIADIIERLNVLQWNEKDVFAIHMALEEAIINSIRHGNDCCKEKKVHVEASIFSGGFFSRITDQGRGFNLADVPDPTLEENLDKTCGRGVKLIQTFMDAARYNPVGNELSMWKVRTATE